MLYCTMYDDGRVIDGELGEASREINTLGRIMLTLPVTAVCFVYLDGRS